MNRILVVVPILGLASSAASCVKGIPKPKPTEQATVPAGKYTIGSATIPTQQCSYNGCDASWQARPVQLTSSFGIDVHEVSRIQYAACIEFGDCCGENLEEGQSEEPNQPAYVTFEQAQQYCTWLGMRLPTEAEWEVAARLDKNGVLHTFPWGDAPRTCDQVPNQSCMGKDTRRPDVATNEVDVTPLGIRDMAGSVSEWVLDDFTPLVACRMGLPAQIVCGNSSCPLCSTGAGCTTGCQIVPLSSCSGSGSQAFCPMVPTAEAAADPFFVSPSRSPAGGCGESWGATAVVKGGDAFGEACQQNPAVRRPGQYGNVMSVNGDTRPRNGFRCVKGNAATPWRTGKVWLPQTPDCQPIIIAPSTTEPAGWGSRIRFALVSSSSFVPAKFDSTTRRYMIDTSATCTSTAGTPGNLLAFEGAPMTAFAFELQYGASGMSCADGFGGKVTIDAGWDACGFNDSSLPNLGCRATRIDAPLCNSATWVSTTGLTFDTSCPGYASAGSYRGYVGTARDNVSTICPACTATGCTPAMMNSLCANGVAAPISTASDWGAGIVWFLNQQQTGCLPGAFGTVDLRGKTISAAFSNAPGALDILLRISESKSYVYRATDPTTVSVQVSSFVDSVSRTAITATDAAAVQAILFVVPPPSYQQTPFNFCVTVLVIN